MARQKSSCHMDMRFVIIDVDDVMLDTMQASRLAELAILAPLTQHLGAANADAVHHEFVRAIDTLTQQLRSPSATPSSAYQALRQRIATWQRGLTEAGFEVKEWSRHTLVACALEACGLPVTAAVVQAVAERYWETVAQHTTVFPDAAVLMQQLRAVGVAVHFATNSDGFLTFDEARQTFVYDPEAGRRQKLARLRGLLALGIARQAISIGDPVGKPHLAFFRTVLHDFSTRLGRTVEPQRTVAIGDSLRSDIRPLLDLGVAHGVWLLRDANAFAHQQRERLLQVSVVGTLDAPEVQYLFSHAADATADTSGDK
jgi:phosphoglycolate phosphatase-like HAD superfamily hydrolase